MGINAWLEKHKDDDDFWDLETVKLLEGRTDITAASNLWKKIARGDAGVAETLMWVKIVAKRITADLIETRGQPSSDRERAALRAIGFYGPIDDFRDAKEFMKVFAMFHPLDENGEEMPNVRLTGKQWVKILKGAGYFAGINEGTAINRVNEWRSEFGIE